jgi:excisionase family DNA binding protein
MPSKTLTTAISPQQFAERYGISLRNVHKLLRTGQLSAVNVGVGAKNKRWRIRPEDVEQFESKRLNAPAVRPARRRRRAEQDQLGYTRFFAEA